MIKIIPAIDIIDGKCVRLNRGRFDSKIIYSSDPLSVAMRFADAGLRNLHLVDLDGARQKKIVNWRILEKITHHTTLKVDFGGGIQSDDDLELAFKCGARQITAGSVAVKNEKLVESWLRKYGADKIILGADVINGKIAISGWQETSELTLNSFLQRYKDKGIRQVISTDISRDGMLKGPAYELYRSIKSNFPDFYVIASGGVSCIDDIKKLIDMGVGGVIIGKALYEGRIAIEELKLFLC